MWYRPTAGIFITLSINIFCEYLNISVCKKKFYLYTSSMRMMTGVFIDPIFHNRIDISGVWHLWGLWII